eukprot:364133-Chlamydomonas_euryale.AAC.4
MVVTGTCVRTSTAACRLAEGSTDYPLYFTAGVHPHNAKTCNKDTLARLTELASSTKCVAIGECGLDFNRNFSKPEVQIQWFDEQVGGCGGGVCEKWVVIGAGGGEGGSHMHALAGKYVRTRNNCMH